MRLGSCRASGPAFLVSAFIAAGCASDDQGPATTRAGAPAVEDPVCEVGTQRTDNGVPAGKRAIVLGCGRSRSGAALELLSFRDDGGPCVGIAGLPGGTRMCGRAPSERVPPARDAISGGAIVRRSAGAQLELYGETAPTVRRVLTRYRLPHGRSGERRATLIRVSDRAALRAAGIRKPFGYFVGAVPARSRQVSAVALAASGEVLGRLAFDRLARDMHPTVFIGVEDQASTRPG